MRQEQKGRWNGINKVRRKGQARKKEWKYDIRKELTQKEEKIGTERKKPTWKGEGKRTVKDNGTDMERKKEQKREKTNMPKSKGEDVAQSRKF
jgi:hypothetical protein